MDERENTENSNGFSLSKLEKMMVAGTLTTLVGVGITFYGMVEGSPRGDYNDAFRGIAVAYGGINILALACVESSEELRKKGIY